MNKIMYYGWFTAIILLCFPCRSAGQNSFGFRVTPNLITEPKVMNPSEALIFGEKRFAFDAGIDYSHGLNKNFSISAGLNAGLIDFNHVLMAPADAFGDAVVRPESIYSNSSEDNFVYTGLLLTPVYRFRAVGSAFYLSAGPNIRMYFDAPGPDISIFPFNRSTPFDPITDPADFEISIPSARWKISTDITASLAVEREISERTSLLFGFRYNVGLDPVSNGTMYVNMYGQRYDGRFDVRSGYMGLDLQLRYLTKRTVGYSRLAPVASDKQDFRRAFYIDVLGNSPLASLNYDMRIKRYRNDGFGFRAGFGLGALVQSDHIKTPRYFSLPVGVNYILGSRQHGFEAGAGYTVQFITSSPPDASKTTSFANLNIGYRFQPLKDGLLFRLYWAPSFQKSEPYKDRHGRSDFFYAQWAGASIGFSFR